MEQDIDLDWPNLKKYSRENEALGLPGPNDRRVVFMGDSITEEWSNLYPTYFGDRSYINRGIGGQTTPQMLIRFKPDVVGLRPFVVVILAGTNDIAGNTGPANVNMITDNIFSMSEISRSNGIKVVLSSILPVYEYEWAKEIMDPPSTIASVNTKLKEYVTLQDLEYLDYHSEMVDERDGLMKEYSSDGVHPNEKGYEVMSALAEKMLSGILSQ